MLILLDLVERQEQLLIRQEQRLNPLLQAEMQVRSSHLPQPQPLPVPPRSRPAAPAPRMMEPGEPTPTLPPSQPEQEETPAAAEEIARLLGLPTQPS